MKTLELKLKKDVLIIDAEGLEITQALIFNKFGNYNLSYYDYICKGSELTEEIASELVKKILPLYYAKQNRAGISFNSSKNDLTKSAKESFISEIKSKKFYWLENPICKILVFLENVSEIDKQIALQKQEIRWQEAEEKTFKNPLIFVKK